MGKGGKTMESKVWKSKGGQGGREGAEEDEAANYSHDPMHEK